MWIFTQEGHVSVVKDRNSENLIVRSRRRKDLERIRECFSSTPPEIHSTPDRDYPFRIFIHPRIFGRVVSNMIELIDYPNFKGRIEEISDTTNDVERVVAHYQVYQGATRLQGPKLMPRQTPKPKKGGK